jgi:hypothetical protein
MVLLGFLARCSRDLPEKPSRGAAYVAAMGFVKAQLKAPSQSELTSINESRITEHAEGTFIVEGFVTAPNVFGVRIREKFTCKVTSKHGNPWNLDSLEFHSDLRRRSFAKVSPETQAFSDGARTRRDSVGETLSQGRPSTRIDFKRESPKLNLILSKLGFDSPTITEGIREDSDGGFIYRLEVMMETDYYVVLKTNAAITEGTLISKAKGSPWSK